MHLSDVRFLFGYDRWATTRLLDAAAGVDAATWAAPNTIGERGLGGVLVHMLGATGRWRHLLSGSAAAVPRPENDPLPTVDALRAAWNDEWTAFDAWLASLDDAAMELEEDGIRMWQALAHVVNHGTQHRSEAAVLLTAVGQSPGDLDMVDYAETLVGAAT